MRTLWRNAFILIVLLGLSGCGYNKFQTLDE